MSDITFETGSLIVGRQNQMGVFDADMNRSVRNASTNADLTVYLRIHFQRIDPRPGVAPNYRDSDGSPVPIRAWRADEWQRWKARFVRDCQRKWDGKFWLVTPASYNRLNWPDVNPTHRCNLYCRFQMEEQTYPEGAHAVIPVVRVDGRFFFRSNMLLYSNNDLRRERITRGSYFYTHVHEIGHLIGLDHPGIGRPGCLDGSEDACYASTDGDDRGAMARGSEMRPEYARPWTTAASTLTGVPRANWVVSMVRTMPQRLSGR